jgi:hypothetical protein
MDSLHPCYVPKDSLSKKSVGEQFDPMYATRGYAWANTCKGENFWGRTSDTGPRDFTRKDMARSYSQYTDGSRKGSRA